jgi:hypothetical protein
MTTATDTGPITVQIVWRPTAAAIRNGGPGWEIYRGWRDAPETWAYVAAMRRRTDVLRVDTFDRRAAR